MLISEGEKLRNERVSYGISKLFVEALNSGVREKDEFHFTLFTEPGNMADIVLMILLNVNISFCAVSPENARS